MRVGGDLLPHARTDLTEGEPVVAYARPHDTEIVSDGLGASGVAARVNRVLANGGISRVELIANGPERGGAKDYFEVEIGRTTLQTCSLQTASGFA